MHPTMLSGCAIIKDDCLLLLFKRKRQHYEFPGGKVEPGENLKNAAIREIKEELGCGVDITGYLGYKEFTIDDRHFRSHNFLAEVVDGTPHVAEPDVFEKMFWMPIADYKKYIVAPNVKAFCDDYLASGIEGMRRPFPY